MLTRWFKTKKEISDSIKTKEKDFSEKELVKLANIFNVAKEDIRSIIKRSINSSYVDTDLLKIGSLLLRSGLISEKIYLEKIKEILNIEIIDPCLRDQIQTFDIKPELLKELRLIPLYVREEKLVVAMADPRDIFSMEIIEKLTQRKVVPVLSTEEKIIEAINRFYEGKKSQVDEIISSIDDSDAIEDNIEQLKDLASEAPIIRLVNILINRAVEKGASDIHIEPFEREVKVRFRIDGVLHEIETLPKQTLPAIISRIKIMSKLDIAEKRLPQDGRIQLKVEGKNIDLRVSTLPTLFGEEVVLRILDRTQVMLNLEDLGFPQKVLEQFKDLIISSHGMILVTGPTGSGKTTTLYASLNTINTPDKKIITIEDPVEYQLNGINQIQANPQIGLSFAKGLRTIVRQDPDIVMVGEIRDLETAEVAVQAALTGHLVFSTLHTNDAASAITRLIEMGVEDYLVASSVIAILAQRLVRIICPYCREKVSVTPSLKKLFYQNNIEVQHIFRSKGCEKCDFTGYRGRQGIFELLIIEDEIREMISQNADSENIKKKAISLGMTPLLKDGLNKVVQGLTTVEEVLRVAQKGLSAF
jgi:type II secretion system protein E